MLNMYNGIFQIGKYNFNDIFFCSEYLIAATK